jgi:hypothetical protein
MEMKMNPHPLRKFLDLFSLGAGFFQFQFSFPLSAGFLWFKDRKDLAQHPEEEEGHGPDEKSPE